jgi:hypothetical protein
MASTVTERAFPQNPSDDAEVCSIIQYLQKVRTKEPSTVPKDPVVQACYQKALDDLLPVCKRLAKGIPASWAIVFRWKAMCEVALHRFEDAMKSWHIFKKHLPEPERLEGDRGTKEFYLSYIVAAARAKSHASIVAGCQEASKVYGSDPAFFANGYVAHIHLGQWQEAVAILREGGKSHYVLQIASTVCREALFLYQVGVCDKLMGHFLQAREIMSAAKQLYPESSTNDRLDCDVQLQCIARLNKAAGSMTSEQADVLAKKADITFDEACRLIHVYRAMNREEDVRIWGEKVKLMAQNSAQEKTAFFLNEGIKEWRATKDSHLGVPSRDEVRGGWILVKLPKSLPVTSPSPNANTSGSFSSAASASYPVTTSGANASTIAPVVSP